MRRETEKRSRKRGKTQAAQTEVTKAKTKFLPFEEARKFVHGLKLRNVREYEKWCISGNKPEYIPSHPKRIYEKEWKGWKDWLNNYTKYNFNTKFLPFEEARKFVHNLKLNNQDEWREYSRSGRKPENIPATPEGVYKNIGWKGMRDWLGIERIAHKDRIYKSFEEARKFVHSLGLKSSEEWYEFCKSGKKPDDVPFYPQIIYKNEWKGMPDFLGYEGHWTIARVKGLLRDWIKSGYIYQEDEIVLYHLLTTKGLLNLHGRHAQVFKSLIGAARKPEGRKALEEYVNSDLQTPPESLEEDEEIGIASSQEIANLVENESKNPLDYGKIKTVEQIFATCNKLESYTEDIESMQFYVNKSTRDLWSNAFRDEKDAISKVRNEGKNGNRYHDTVQEIFLSDYEGAQSIQPPEGYAFRDKDNKSLEPTLMQRYVAYKVKTNRHFGNFSGTGTGKTLSAVLTSRVINSRMTLIVCPNDVVDQWKTNILEIFPDSVVITKKEAFDEEYDQSKNKYLVLNYDLFSQPYSPNLILDLVKQKIDFVVL
ncbi:MAG: hypothetical protein JO327_03715, partial [Nitrososphaeraceae archaeon]|nr:hypothetical protein [Nitrososphaeraceae archaeon]